MGTRRSTSLRRQHTDWGSGWTQRSTPVENRRRRIGKIYPAPIREAPVRRRPGGVHGPPLLRASASREDRRGSGVGRPSTLPRRNRRRGERGLPGRIRVEAPGLDLDRRLALGQWGGRSGVRVAGPRRMGRQTLPPGFKQGGLSMRRPTPCTRPCAPSTSDRKAATSIPRRGLDGHHRQSKSDTIGPRQRFAAASIGVCSRTLGRDNEVLAHHGIAGNERAGEDAKAAPRDEPQATRSTTSTDRSHMRSGQPPRREPAPRESGSPATSGQSEGRVQAPS